MRAYVVLLRRMKTPMISTVPMSDNGHYRTLMDGQAERVDEWPGTRPRLEGRGIRGVWGKMCSVSSTLHTPHQHSGKEDQENFYGIKRSPHDRESLSASSLS